ncbi:unnamed protein product [Closterium sp. NIES-65]|nr:unnamed protein product [Closterium sp. NIES-65]
MSCVSGTAAKDASRPTEKSDGSLAASSSWNDAICHGSGGSKREEGMKRFALRRLKNGRRPLHPREKLRSAMGAKPRAPSQESCGSDGNEWEEGMHGLGDVMSGWQQLGDVMSGWQQLGDVMSGWQQLGEAREVKEDQPHAQAEDQPHAQAEDQPHAQAEDQPHAQAEDQPHP